VNRRLLPLALAAFCLTACGTGGAASSAAPAAHARTTTATREGHAATASRPATASQPVCGPPRHAWADEVSPSGRVLWQVKLPTDPASSGVALRPLVIGGEAVFAEYNALHALRLSDGHQLWQRSYPNPGPDSVAGLIFGLWYWHGTVVALVGQVSTAARLTALDAATGAVRWTLKLPSYGVLGSQAMTANGVLGIQLTNGVIEAADLSTGTLLWARKNGTSPGPVAVGDVIAAGSNGRAIGYDARTGRVLWTAHGLPATTVLTEADDLVLVQSDEVGGAGEPATVTALQPRTGRVAWRFDVGIQPQILGAGPAGIVMAIYNPDRVYLVNQGSGRARWSAGTFATALTGNAELIVTADSVVQIEGRGVPRLVSRRADDGKVLWSRTLNGSPGDFHLALTSASAVVVTMGPSGGGTPAKPSTVSPLWVFNLATGQRTGHTTLPTLVQAPLATAGAKVVLQLDDPVCAIPLTGAVTTDAGAPRPRS